MLKIHSPFSSTLTRPWTLTHFTRPTHRHFSDSSLALISWESIPDSPNPIKSGTTIHLGLYSCCFSPCQRLHSMREFSSFSKQNPWSHICLPCPFPYVIISMGWVPPWKPVQNLPMFTITGSMPWYLLPSLLPPPDLFPLMGPLEDKVKNTISELGI